MSSLALAPDGHSPPSASTTSLTIPASVHSARSGAPSARTGTRTVVTSPPWARDEPPSPYDHDAPASRSKDRLSEQPRPSDVASYQSSSINSQDPGPSRWWTFASTRNRPNGSTSVPLATQETKQSGARSINIPWLTAYSSHRRSQDEEDMSTIRGKDLEVVNTPTITPAPQQSRFHLDLPRPDLTMTLAQNFTPGWDSPWSPRPPTDLVARITANGTVPSDLLHGDLRDEDSEKFSLWARRKKKIRMYMLTNTYVPLLFRFVNITFTTAALGMGIRIRMRERRHNVMGAVGVSPTLVVIFAPPTIVHVMLAVYLEYFGPPLGVWRTSGKLAHTISEVVFICAWSAALALTFDNFFSSRIPCTDKDDTSWYNQLPVTPPLPDLDRKAGHAICKDQEALIVLVGIGLIMYCFNLVISLFRIFEKVKYHPAAFSVT